jgi:hypothetical protein
MQAQLHYPGEDLSPIVTFLDDLAGELSGCNIPGAAHTSRVYIHVIDYF